MVLPISTTKLVVAEVVVGYYNLLRWTCKPSDYYLLNSKTNLQAARTTHNNDNIAMVLDWY